MRERDIRLIHLVEADLAAVNRALHEISNVAIGAYNAACALQATRHKLRQELMQALFNEYAQGVELASGVIILKPRNRHR
jgi:hypothetical protein